MSDYVIGGLLLLLALFLLFSYCVEGSGDDDAGGEDNDLI